ncbi:hypothetical protein AVEN_185278-1 [Araneus ventricosus]|uniref:Uncharacterized protein n=1 Tax=Araneus ventricosus TaxID=182803 RepID=A0A4Y1ZV16_ARAVE|nr:hypothetical protein AVEN_185278-1 [Araneus ventricosus]
MHKGATPTCQSARCQVKNGRHDSSRRLRWAATAQPLPEEVTQPPHHYCIPNQEREPLTSPAASHPGTCGIPRGTCSESKWKRSKMWFFRHPLHSQGV